MNCDLCRRYLLAAEEPSRPTGPAALHLAACPACRAWHARLVAVESDLTKLPVPDASAARARFLRRVRGTTRRAPVIAPRRWQPSVQERARRKLSVAMALAASLLAFALVWSAWPQPTKPPPRFDPESWGGTAVVTPLRQMDNRVQRVEFLATKADGLQQDLFDQLETNDPDQLDRLARCYTWVVQQHLVREAETLNPEERQQVLRTLAGRLEATALEAEGRLKTLGSPPPQRIAGPLKEVAQAARHGHDRVLALIPSA